MTVIYLLLIVTGAVVFDLSTDTIPNKYLIAGFIFLSFQKIIEVGTVGFGVGVLSGVMPMVILFPLFVLGLMGGGDIKLIGIIGFYLPIDKLMIVLAVSVFVAGFISIVKLIRFGIHGDCISGLMQYLIEKATVVGMQGVLAAMDESYIRMEAEEVTERGIHFSVPLLAAVILVIGFNYLG